MELEKRLPFLLSNLSVGLIVVGTVIGWTTHWSISMPGIFISYRRKDSGGWAGRLAADLRDRFGDNFVFFDRTSIDPGERVRDHIAGTIKSCDAFLVVISETWADVMDEQGCRRLDSPEDYVKFEVATALCSKRRIIPILVGGATYPDSKLLPDDIKDLSKYNAMEMSDAYWKNDIQRIVETIETFTGIRAWTSLFGKLPYPAVPWLYFGIIVISLALVGFAFNSQTYTGSVSTFPYYLYLMFAGLLPFVIGSFISIFSLLNKALKPLWNGTIAFSLIAGCAASLVGGSLYAAGLHFAPPNEEINPVWYIRFFRFWVIATLISFAYGTLFSLWSAMRRDATFRPSLASLILLPVIVIVFSGLAWLGSHMSELAVFGKKNQGDATYETYVASVGVYVLFMIAFENLRNYPGAARTVSRFFAALVIVFLSGVLLALLFWGRGLGPTEEGWVLASFGISLLLTWSFSSFLVFTGDHPIVRKIDCKFDCCKSLSEKIDHLYGSLKNTKLLTR